MATRIPRMHPVTGSEIAARARAGIGTRYVWGGAGPPRKGWDCSGMVNWDLGAELGLTLPGGVKNFDGSSHGPVVFSYYTWRGARTVSMAQAQPGDLILYVGLGNFRNVKDGGHIGIYVGNGELVSALDPQDGTKQTSIAEAQPPLTRVVVRRVKAATFGSATASTTATPAQAAALAKAGCLLSLALLPLLPVLGPWRAIRARRAGRTAEELVPRAADVTTSTEGDTRR